MPRGPAAAFVAMVVRGCPRAVLSFQRVTVTGTGLLARLVWLGDTGVNCSGAAGARGGASPIVTQTNQARTHCGTVLNGCREAAYRFFDFGFFQASGIWYNSCGMYGVFVSFLELVAVFTFCYWGGSGVRAAWACCNLNNNGNAGLPARNSNNSTGNSNWNGSAGSPGLVWGQSAPCTENIYCAVYSAPIGKIVLKPAEASSCGERHRRHKPRD